MSAWTRELLKERGEILALIVNANREIDRLRAENELLRRALEMACREPAVQEREP